MMYAKYAQKGPRANAEEEETARFPPDADVTFSQFPQAFYVVG
jgi:hypothetical protein